MRSFHIPATDPNEHPESLALALLTVLQAHASHATYDDLAVALGLAFMTCGDRDEPDVAAFADLARDVALEPAAELFGVRVRPLHSRTTTETLTPSPEFALHFRDSYVPLIQRAVAHGQPVLAWRGWPTPADRNWGLVTEADAAGGLRGVVPGCPDVVPLDSAALQCYVVEEVAARSPAPADILACGAAGLARLDEECADHGTRVAGAFAWRLWGDRLRSVSDGDDAGLAPHLNLARHVSANRQTAGRWLARWAEVANPSRAADQALIEIVRALVAGLQQVIADLETSGPAAAGEALAACAEADGACLSALQRVTR